MKTRQGFVSNSSSSSFIVALKSRQDKTAIRLNVDLSQFGDFITTQVQLDQRFCEDYGLDSIEEISQNYDDFAKTYQACLQAIKDKKALLIGSLSSEGEPLEQMLYQEGLKNLKGDIKIIADVSN